jgi:hypothetical protein
MIGVLRSSFPSFYHSLPCHDSPVTALLFGAPHFPFTVSVSEQLQLLLDSYYGAPDGYHYNLGIYI